MIVRNTGEGLVQLSPIEPAKDIVIVTSIFRKENYYEL